MDGNKVEAGKQVYEEIKIGKTIYQVTSIFKNELSLKETLEDAIADKIVEEILLEYSKNATIGEQEQ